MLGTVASLRSSSRVVFTDARPFGARALQRPRPFRKATGLFVSICWLGKMSDYWGRERGWQVVYYSTRTRKRDARIVSFIFQCFQEVKMITMVFATHFYRNESYTFQSFLYFIYTNQVYSLKVRMIRKTHDKKPSKFPSRMRL